mgnify:FL=1
MSQNNTLENLLEKVKKNLIISHSEDDDLIREYIKAAICYAESYQKLKIGYYYENTILPTTEQAIVMLSSHFYESRDGSAGGFFADNVSAASQVWTTVNVLLRPDKNWKI